MTNSQDKPLIEKMVSIAKEVISGTLHPIVGIRSLNALRNNLSDSENEVFYTIIALDSDSDTFALGEFREKCSAEYLSKKDKEMAEFIDFYRNDIYCTCQKIIDSLTKRIKSAN